MTPIDADLLKQAIEEELDTNPFSDGLKTAVRCFVERQIEKQPILSVDMYSGENRKSRWVVHPKYKFTVCEHCEMRPYKTKGAMGTIIDATSEFCPHCGCRMVNWSQV